MKYWLINHPETYEEEHRDGFIWGSKITMQQRPVPQWDALAFVQKDDRVVSFVSRRRIGHVGTVLTSCVDAEKPAVFDSIGPDWPGDGRMITVDWMKLPQSFTIHELLDTGKFYIPSVWWAYNNPGTKRGYIMELKKSDFDAVLQLGQVPC